MSYLDHAQTSLIEGLLRLGVGNREEELEGV